MGSITFTISREQTPILSTIISKVLVSLWQRKIYVRKSVILGHRICVVKLLLQIHRRLSLILAKSKSWRDQEAERWSSKEQEGIWCRNFKPQESRRRLIAETTRAICKNKKKTLHFRKLYRMGNFRLCLINLKDKWILRWLLNRRRTGTTGSTSRLKA